MVNNPTIPCVIYTRKSSDEGLDQAFNSLDAQYEACQAYVESQKHEGWKLSKLRYDDGGISGATLSRPGLERLLSDLDKGLVKMIVVYKIDRLTRSLADFTRLVERMDAAGCSFVSVTQAFNTSNSMGRLTLNVLLSFAQFEREVTAERIRDKIAASKAKGMWMGGYPPLGYDRDPDPNIQSLVVNQKEAQNVTTIFGLFERYGRLVDVEREASQLAIRSKLHVFPNGNRRGGSLMSRGQIHALLTNPVYAGMIRHKDNTYDGLHKAIIDPERWQKVQAMLSNNARKPRKSIVIEGVEARPILQTPDSEAPLLKGFLFDECGDRLTPSWSSKGKRRYRYYLTKTNQKPKSESSRHNKLRLPAKPIEQIVIDTVVEHLNDPNKFAAWLAIDDVVQLPKATSAANTLAKAIKEQANMLRIILMNVTLGEETLYIKLDATLLGQVLGVCRTVFNASTLEITVPFTRRRRGNETKLVISNHHNKTDPVLIKTLALSHRWLKMLKHGKSIDEIATSEGYSNSYIRTRMPMALLSPSIQKAILNGRHPIELTADTIARKTLPIIWSEQKQLLGFKG